MIPQPKHSIGDTVYAVRLDEIRTTIPCPECQGHKVCHLLIAGRDPEPVACPACREWLKDYSSGTMIESKLEPRVQTLTIGTIRINTGEADDEIVTYMCKETGIGSGSVWRENKLYTTKEDAEAAFPALLGEREQNIRRNFEHCARTRDKALEDDPGTAYRRRIKYAEEELERLEKMYAAYKVEQETNAKAAEEAPC